MNKNILIILIVVVLVITGGLAYWLYQSKTEIIKPISIEKFNLDPKNCTYSIEGQNVTLKNGYSKKEIVPGSASKQITQYFGNTAVGDFNGDGAKDAAFILVQDDGGSGTFYYVAVALDLNNACIGTNAVLLGDRIAPQTTEFNNGEIVVNYADRKPNEPMTATPTMGISKYFKIRDGKLVEVTKPSSSCVPNWQCGWGPCINSYQSQVAVDLNGCGLSSAGVNIACPALAKMCSKTGEVTRKVGDREFNFLIQKINTNSVDGLWYVLYPVAMLQGQSKTLHIGDVVGYACEGKTAILSSIDVANQTVVFKESIKTAPPGGCPI